MSRRVGLALAVVLGGWWVCGAKAASYTDISSTSWDAAGNLISALNSAYGSTWGNINTASYTTNSLTLKTSGSSSGQYLVFQRIADEGGSSPLNIHGTGVGAEDQTFQDGTGAFTFEIKWAGNSEAFGWYEGNTLNQIFNTSQGDNPGSTKTLNLSSNFGFYITSPFPNGTTWYSEESKNLVNNQTEDHLVTYRVFQYDSGNNLIVGQQPEWLLAFEDLPLGGGDRDYQDVIVSLKATPVPLPAAAWSGLAMLGGLGVFGAWRRKVRSALGTR
jgi:hypothetical protein